ncbi:MAG: hypothetical protein WAZ41_06460 [Gemmiger qucibialis]
MRGAFAPEARCGYRNPTLSSILATQMRAAAAGAVLEPLGGNCAVLPLLFFCSLFFMR